MRRDPRYFLDRAGVFFRTPEGHAAIIGGIGSLMMLAGGFGAGSVRRDDPLLDSLQLSWVRFGHGLVLATILTWAGVLVMIAAWVKLGRATLAGGVTLNELRIVVAIWVAPLLVSVPLFSRDTYSYLAQGALVQHGFDPYAVGPSARPGVLLDNVHPIWANTTCPYGPLFILLARGVTTLTGDNVVAGTIVLRLVMLPGLILMMWAIPHIARHLGGKPAVALWLAVLNPLVLLHMIGGVHNDMLMVGFMAAGIALVLERHHLAGIGLVALAAAIKATAGVAVPFLIWIWMVHERERQREAAAAAGTEPGPYHDLRVFLRTAVASVGIFGAVFALSSLIAGVGFGWITALQGSQYIINWLSLPTVWAHQLNVITWLMGDTGFGSIPPHGILDTTRGLCALLLAIILVVTWWRCRHTERDALRGLLICFIAIVVLSPAALPWYYSWPLALAAGFALSDTTVMVLVGVCTFLMTIFRPDGPTGQYTWYHVVAAAIVSLIAAAAMRYPDPLHLRARKPKTTENPSPPEPALVSAAPAPAVTPPLA